jgi:hypothetical protein
MRAHAYADSPNDVIAEIAALKAEIAYLRRFAPPQPPPGWLNVKRAAQLAHCSDQLVYKWRRRGRLPDSIKVRGRIWINPYSLPV